jgi:hypothetical protein
MMKKLNLIMSFFFIFINSASAKVSLPASLQKILKEQSSYQSVHVAVSCKLGLKKISAMGLLTEEKGIKAWIAIEEKSKWKLYPVADEVKSSKGGGSLLGDFINEKGKYSGDFEIRCTHPKFDEDLSLKSGEYVSNFSVKWGKNSKHLCFLASSSYNNWKCLSIDPKTNQPSTTFVQLGAD